MKDFEQPEPQEKKELPKPKRVFIEIGTSDLPVTWIGSKEFSENDIYVGIDINPETIRRGKKYTEDINKQVKSAFFVQANAVKLPVKDNSTDEVFLGDVLGYPRITTDIKIKILNEAKRAPRVGGKITIKETNTPLLSAELNDLLKTAGLEIDEKITPASKNWGEALSHYDKISAPLEQEGYLISLKPKNN